MGGIVIMPYNPGYICQAQLTCPRELLDGARTISAQSGLEQQWRVRRVKKFHPYRQYRVHPPDYTRQTPELHTEELND